METSQDSSYSEFFRELREEANSYISAKRPMASLRKPSTQLEGLQRENEELRAQVRFLEQDNLRLRTHCAELEDSVRRLTDALHAASLVQTECAEDCSSLSGSEDDVLLVPLDIASPAQEQSRDIVQSDLVSRLRKRVKKHQTFIQHMKKSLERLLQDRLRERADHMRTKTKLANLLRSLTAPDDARKPVYPGN